MQFANPKTPDALLKFTYHYASTYLDRGYSVIPLNRRAKTPMIPWKAYQHQLPTNTEIVNWFGAGKNEFNLGIVTGATSDLVVVDVDSASDAKFWRSKQRDTPLVVRTGGGGFHFYYRYPKHEAVGNRVRVFNRAIDIRGDGGYVVAPPSVSAQGVAYEWVGAFEEYSLDDIPRFQSEWIADTPKQTSNLPGSATPCSKQIRNARAYIRRIVAISGNNGHNATYRVACILREAGLSPVEALSELKTWSEQCAHPPWTDKELQHKITSAYCQDSA